MNVAAPRHVALVLLAAALAGCGRNFEEARRAAAPGTVPLSECRFEMARDLPSAAGAQWDVQLKGASYHFRAGELAGGVKLRAGNADVEAAGDQIVIVATTDGGVAEITGTQAGAGLSLSDPRAVAGTTGEVADPVLCRSTDRLQLLWTETSADTTRLMHSVRTDRTGTWSEPRLVTATANPGSGNVVALGEDVYIVWSDSRFRANYVYDIVNKGKILVERSTDNGDSFGRPVLLNEMHNTKDTARTALLVPAGDDLLLFQGGLSWADSNLTLKAFRLDRDLTTLTEIGEVRGDEVQRARDERLRAPLSAVPARRTGRRPRRGRADRPGARSSTSAARRPLGPSRARRLSGGQSASTARGVGEGGRVGVRLRLPFTTSPPS